MPAKYSHVKKRSASGLLKKEKNGTNGHHLIKEAYHPRIANPHVDRTITQAMSAVSQLERAIAKILLIRFEHDIARLYSTRLYRVALTYIPTFVMRCVTLGGPGWLAFNYDSDEVKDFLRAAISMDMRQAGERVATKSVLWSYTALRHFAISNNVTICSKLGLHSIRLLPYYPALQAHLESLESMPQPLFAKPPHLGTLDERQQALEHACELKFTWANEIVPAHPDWDDNWREKVRFGYDKLIQTLWRVAREFNVKGYGAVLREKLTSKWCDCGCSTDHLGEVCEKTVREEEEESGVRTGKQREWDGRGSGVYGWEAEEEEDIWEAELDFGGPDPDECAGGIDSEMTIGEMMEYRFLKAEQEKELGNAAFRKGDFETAVRFYQKAHEIEPELPHYELNLAAAHLKLNNWIEAENACTSALKQHRSSKGLYRRAKARRMLLKAEEAIQDLRAVLRLQPNNHEALAELIALIPAPNTPLQNVSNNAQSSSSSKAPSKVDSDADILRRLGVQKPKPVKEPPFARARSDDRKLKILILSGSEGFGSNKKNGGKVQNPKPSQPSRHGKEKAGTVKPASIREMDKMRTECVSYPGWDRYTVKKVD